MLKYLQFCVLLTKTASQGKTSHENLLPHNLLPHLIKITQILSFFTIYFFFIEKIYLLLRQIEQIS